MSFSLFKAAESNNLPGPVQTKYNQLVAKYKTVGVGSRKVRSTRGLGLARDVADMDARQDYAEKANLLEKKTKVENGVSTEYLSGTLTGISNIDAMIHDDTIYVFVARDPDKAETAKKILEMAEGKQDSSPAPSDIAPKEDATATTSEAASAPKKEPETNGAGASPLIKRRMEDDEMHGQSARQQAVTPPAKETAKKPGSSSAEIKKNNEEALDWIRLLEQGGEQYAKSHNDNPILSVGSLKVNTQDCNSALITNPMAFKGTLSAGDMTALKRWTGGYSSWRSLFSKLQKAAIVLKDAGAI